MTPLDGHTEAALEQNTQDVRRIVIWFVSVLIAIVGFVSAGWIGSISGRVSHIEEMQSEVQAKQIVFDKDHDDFKAWLTRVESKLDKAISRGLLD